MKNRIIWKKLAKEINTPEVIVITGPRQVGKTTTLNWLMDQIQSANKLYIDLQNLADRELFEVKNYDTILNELKRRNLNPDQKIYLFIDEIQLLSNLPEVVKYLYDHYQIKFFLTGSSSFYIKNQFSESMAGRKLIYEMFPLRFQEFLTFKNIDYTLPESLNPVAKFDRHAFNALSALYEEYINYGGLPKIVLTNDLERKTRFLQEIYSSYITLDVEVLSDFKSSGDFRKVVKLLATRIGSRLNINQISKITGLSRPTIENYITFLEQTYLIRNIPVFTKSSDVAIRNLTKCYFVDTGIANINADLAGGAKFENTIAHQLSFYGPLQYYSSGSSEIDFILNQTQAYEVKETPTDSDLNKLQDRSQPLGLNQYSLIGRHPSATFDNFIWGGTLK